MDVLQMCKNTMAGMKIIMFPYCEYPAGKWSIPDRKISRIYQLMERDNTVHASFPDGSVTDAESFMSEMRHGSHLFVFGSEDLGLIAGIGWLNNFSGRRGMVHFCVFSELWGNPDLINLIDWSAQRLLRLKGMKEDKYLVDVLIGSVKASNERAISVSRKIANMELGRNSDTAFFLHARKNKGAYEDYYKIRD